MPDALITIPDVELLAVGDWQSGLSGNVPITAEDIDAIIAAGLDPETDQAALRIGHIDPRFDGEPALGWIRNLRNVGGRLVGDIQDAPAKMQDLIRSAYRRRSAEIAWGVKTPSGRVHRASLTGLALLGVTPPAVKGLADVAARYSGSADSTSRVVKVDDDELGTVSVRLSGNSFNNGGPTGDNASRVPISVPGGSTVNDDEVRAALGLGADVPVTDLLRRAATAVATPDPAPPTDPPAPPPEPAQPPATPPAPSTEPVVPPTITVDRGVWEEVRAKADRGDAAATTLANLERERVLESALLAGQIVPASVDAYRALYDSNPEGTKTLLSGLPKGFSTISNFSGSVGMPAPDGRDANGLTDEDWNKSDFYSDITKFMRMGSK